MQANIEKVKPEIMQKLSNPNNLISELADEYGISRRIIYHWIKLEQKRQRKFKNNN